MDKQTIIAGILSIFLVVILESIGISSLLIYTNNHDNIISNVTSCENDRVNFLLGYGITSIIFGLIWIPIILFNFIFGFNHFLEKQLDGAFVLIIIILTGFLTAFGVSFGATYIFSNVSNTNCRIVVNYSVWSMCAAIFGINMIIIGICMIYACANLFISCSNDEEDE